MKKECVHHGLTEFSIYENKRYRCKKCGVDAVNKRRRRIKEKAVEYKGGKCEICSYNKNIGALQFHHLDPSKKDFAISHKGYSTNWDKVKQELDKCMLVCANCHFEIHNAC